MSCGLVLTATVLGLGMHQGAWRFRDGDPFDHLRLDHHLEIARLAEAGGLHALFLADTLDGAEERYARPSLGALDPVVVLAAAAAVTERIGLVATSSTSFNEPYNLARRFASLDRISGGRAGWNAVTTFVPTAAAQFGDAPLPDHAARYARAAEFLDVVTGLWDSWDDDALVGDKATGRYVDADHVHPLHHRGEHFSVAGPAPLPGSAQGRPVIFQAGSSGPGRDLAARYADVVFTAQNTLEAARAFRADLRARAAALGRDPDTLLVLPGLTPVLGDTDEAAAARKTALDEARGIAPELEKLALRVGVPVAELALDEPLPVERIRADAGFRGSHGFRDAAVELAVRRGLTVRELLAENGGGHLQVVGTPDRVADVVETWVDAGAADGFNLMVDVVPDGLAAIVDEVVPRLRKRGRFPAEYAGSTLREHLGLPLPT
ncbi:NtaA/DmoA family FMN-dependent monooxygenase [Actinomycetospora sp. TBRC 11914]|uniref:NtaA/DmoA family FMN-dependent monooxygenase n=1 Tax=Actinomycetospora sp. TBRC 11914 TaxID=2729387 RepID=UPI00145EA6B8|nr:NtaA/DmoA family FMN-dependent monooxygenase [Actinomycetospora sp. TBRC 11914]NMO93136.1 NtaA/DmoA family FMN-dependent monooxygenase [Actinomycetospora sp. TBRC 11914]